MKETHDKWIDEDDLMTYSGLSKSFWQKERMRGTGPAYSKIGRSVRYRLSDVIAYLEAHKTVKAQESDGQANGRDQQ